MKNAMKKTSRRHRLYNSRSPFVPLSYKDKWAELGPIYMSKESDDPGDPEVVIVKKLTWRSAELNELIRVVDAEKEHKESSSRTGFEPQKLKRIPGPPSSLPPPADAPAWTLKQHATPSGSSRR